jgi:hypothetical protein
MNALKNISHVVYNGPRRTVYGGIAKATPELLDAVMAAVSSGDQYYFVAAFTPAPPPPLEDDPLVELWAAKADGAAEAYDLVAAYYDSQELVMLRSVILNANTMLAL